jgi:hypothetical protein
MTDPTPNRRPPRLPGCWAAVMVAVFGAVVGSAVSELLWWWLRP